MGKFSFSVTAIASKDWKNSPNLFCYMFGAFAVGCRRPDVYSVGNNRPASTYVLYPKKHPLKATPSVSWERKGH